MTYRNFGAVQRMFMVWIDPMPMTFCRPVNVFDKVITTRTRGRFVLFRRPPLPPGHIPHLVLGYVEWYP